MNHIFPARWNFLCQAAAAFLKALIVRLTEKMLVQIHTHSPAQGAANSDSATSSWCSLVASFVNGLIERLGMGFRKFARLGIQQ